MGRVCSSKWQLVRKERIKARIPVAPPEPMRISTEWPQALREAKPTINIKEDVGIPWGNKWGCVLNKRVGGGGPGSLEVPQTDHRKMEKMRPPHYGDAVEIADDNLIWNQLESFPSSSGLGVCSTSLWPSLGNALTCLEPSVIAGASDQLERPAEPHCMLGRAVRGLDTANKCGHFPFRLTGGWGQVSLVALVQWAGPDGVCHGQHRNLEDRKKQKQKPSMTFFFTI